MIHNVSIDYCSCGNTAKSEVEQLLERRLYPATIQNPKTAATFRALELFELLQYESKLSPYEFYNTISRLTDNTGLDPPKVRSPQTLVRLYSNTDVYHTPGSLPEPPPDGARMETLKDAKEGRERARSRGRSVYRAGRVCLALPTVPTSWH